MTKLAESEAAFILAEAEAEAAKIERLATMQGLAALYTSLNLTDAKHKGARRPILARGVAARTPRRVGRVPLTDLTDGAPRRRGGAAAAAGAGDAADNARAVRG